jgi:hypothetical protein
MKSKLSISGNGHFTLYLIPETEAERDILRRVAECKNMTSADRLKQNQWSSGSNDHIEIMPMPPAPEVKKE